MPRRGWSASRWQIVSVALALGTNVGTGTVFTLELGTTAPPSTMGDYAVTRYVDPGALGSTVTEIGSPPDAAVSGHLVFDQGLEHQRVGNGWSTWSHGYQGDVYWFDELLLGNQLTLTLPDGTMAFQFYLAPDYFGSAEFEISSAGASRTLSIEGQGGAQGIGFYSDTPGEALSAIRIEKLSADFSNGFALGEFAINGTGGVFDTPDSGLPWWLLSGFWAALVGGRRWVRFGRRAVLACLLTLGLAAPAGPPVVKTVPWVAGNALIPHTTFAGKAVRLKGTADPASTGLRWTWDFGDGSPVATGTVTDPYAIEAAHAYAGSVGTVFTARLTVDNPGTGEAASKAYFVQLEARTLAVEANIAIDEGLWYLHKTQRRSGAAGSLVGDWANGAAGSGWNGVSVANLNAFEVNGHLESGSPEDPYTETVQRSMRLLFEWLALRPLGVQNNGVGSNLNPDSNGNGYGVFVGQGYSYYQGGMFMDALVASGTPNAVATSGALPSGSNPGIRGRTYASILQDMVDDHAWAQYDAAPGGGWRYSANEYPDNSACQWAAIGLIAAERNWGLTVPQWVKTWNLPWLAATQGADGSFGYTGTSPVWGPYATTPSGMVQMVLDGIGRDMTGPGGLDWNSSEGFLRDRFGSSGGAGVALKDYYYGMFSFVKSMLLHRTDHNADGVLEPDPITLLRSTNPNVPPLDWYGAESSQGAPTDGVARTLVGDQNSGGYWSGHNYTSDQYPFETAWAIMMLHQTLFESGTPVAVAKAIPNPAVVGQVVTLDGSDSYHQDSGHQIVLWEWDRNSDGVIDATGPFTTTQFAAVGDYPIRLRVTDNNTPAKSVESVLTVRVTTPPVAPTADADGPYRFCRAWAPWYLDGRKSFNPDEGGSEPHTPAYPADTLQEYAWDLDGDGQFDDAFGPTPDVTAYFLAQGPGSYLVQLKVTDTTATSYPSSGMGNLSDTSSAQVYVLAENDPDCGCVTLTATPKVKQVELTWTPSPGATGYNVYRAVASAGPYAWVGASTNTTFLDSPGVLNRVYYYVVRPTQLNGDEACQSNEALAEPLHPVPVASATPAAVSNLQRYYYDLAATSQAFGRMQLLLYVGDTASSLVVGPIPNRSIVYLRGGLAAASARPGSGGVYQIILLKGQARVWAVDPIGQKSVEILVR